MNRHFSICTSEQLERRYMGWFDKAYDINCRLFKKEPGSFKISVCHSRQEFKKEAKYYYTKWATATVLRNGNMVIKHHKISDKWKKADYPNVIIHEMNHVFWMRLFKTTKPLWLLEGLACSIGKSFSGYDLGKLACDYKINSKILYYRGLSRKLTGHIPFYPTWQGFTNYIIERKGIRSIIVLMERYSRNPRRSNYDKQFKLLFGKTERQLFADFLEDITAS